MRPEQQLDYKMKQGRPHIVCDMRIVDDNGKVGGGQIRSDQIAAVVRAEGFPSGNV